jgi:hypothetical protein
MPESALSDIPSDIGRQRGANRGYSAKVGATERRGYKLELERLRSNRGDFEVFTRLR